MLDVNEFDSMRIGLASPEKIMEWSHGEVKKPETINYRTLKPERDGLFCERIFGPTKDWECHCGKYKRIRYKGVVCDRCGVEVTRAKVRRERMGHIKLATPVSHIWYFKGIPSRMGLILDISPRALEKVLYFASYIVLDPGDTPLSKQQLLTETEYRQYLDMYGDKFRVGMGAAAVQELLRALDLETLNKELREELRDATGQRRLKAIRRLEVVESFRHSGNKPEWMIMDVIPVIPPELRPMVQLDGGRFATSDLNDLYRRVINRNNRLSRLLNLGAPDIIIRNEKRMLQEAVDALLDNGRRGRPVAGPGNRPLKSLSDMLKGKQGRFRQNLLGKRVDYSGRSVIVVGPELKMHQCGLPKEMALELFKPFVMKKLVEQGIATNIKNAKKKVERVSNEVWDVLEDVITEHPVLLNRAPTLHRLGIQAFEPILWEGRAIKLHPLVCTAFNADFDGDQMACHLPLSVEAQSEARTLMLSAHNILAPKDGKPVAVPTQDMVLGAYYLTLVKPGAKGEGKSFSSYEEVMLAYDAKVIDIEALIKVRIPGHGLIETTAGKLLYNDQLYDELRLYHTDKVMVFDDPQEAVFAYRNGIIDSTHLVKIRVEDGRIQDFGFSQLKEEFDVDLLSIRPLPAHKVDRQQAAEFIKDKQFVEVPCLGVLMNKKEIGKLVDACFHLVGNTKTAALLDRIKNIGYHYARQAGMSIAISDIQIPEGKWTILDAADKQVQHVSTMFQRGLITEDERYRKTCAIWEKATDDVTEVMMDNMDPFNSIFMMADSGARGNKQQIRQVAGMRGLMADPSGRIIDLPIKANFREGLSVLDYFTSSHGARKGLADTALRTADSGYLTRRLVDVSQDVIVREDDCDVFGIDLVRERARLASSCRQAVNLLRDKLIGRVLARNAVDPETKETIFEEDHLLTNDDMDTVIAHKLPKLYLRGSQLDINDDLNHTNNIEIVSLGAPEEGFREAIRKSMVENMLGKTVEGTIYDSNGIEICVDKTPLTEEAIERILQSDVEEVKVRNNDIRGVEVTAIVEGSGVIEPLEERIEGRTAAETLVNPDTGEVIVALNEEIMAAQAKEVAKYYTKVRIRSVLTCHSRYGVCAKCYGRDLGTGGKVNVGESVGTIAAQSIGEPGTQLTMRTFHTGGVASAGDITQGLPRVEELFEARKPKGNAIVTEIDGVISISEKEDHHDINIVHVTNQDGDERSYTIPYGAHLVVHEGDSVKKGARITAGSINPHDILQILGVEATQRYLVYEVQKVYKSQGVGINDKHIEVIVRQMLRKMKIEDAGDADVLPGDYIDVNTFEDMNRRVRANGGKTAEGRPMLLGITKAALATESFLSAASFQETTRVLTDAAIKGKVDPLLGLKENVIIGKLIPAGTGMSRYRKVKVINMVPPAILEDGETGENEDDAVTE
ncbi:DNA-directed RNA polymerase subunit beta' [Megasphaera lornae]|uniref:DNA-directed RNA polymerase subunit beta' n=2 Tax=Megasphaera TaxID=906 RepID=D3LU42_9FIRM|nr:MULTISPECIES: DNA-directed RNA polymerase subunit beta' [Megasphaera]EFD94319.1 DNA-directed RNA polymerase, beta' subunit [Megasphaera genomosp. type_1 str. 28L]EGL39298.1 DNA-directed RNA polymerase, beta' subunit [Megasphaera lornae]KXB91990.1 DNA-directed RNA polymerase, beta' subunit [Veillonellaceae bacterium DNF00751]MUP50556.1 DNA-directed RNA polymerase subunit beta' [Veillonellaceae bacterium M1-70]